ncbi:DUF3159 domain-containing protein [Kitasatospora viridis]|uniref:DUF3159 domain-containing protein n=1 Tax=Kitasatospora viridis TaxID=281105 RepID=UPI0014797D7F|nr:DUF3159 domain-containing protein [Kitasatospora viridis]
MGGLRSRIGPALVLDAVLPPAAFLAGLAAAHGRPLPGVAAAVGAAVLLAALRLARREGVRAVAASTAFVLAAALAVRGSGRAVDFFLPELLLNAALALWFALSLALRRPATAAVLRLLRVRAEPRGQAAVTGVWLAFWCLHVAVETPLYLAGQVFWLGLTRIVLGPLLWLPVGWLSLRAARRHH